MVNNKRKGILLSAGLLVASLLFGTVYGYSATYAYTSTANFVASERFICDSPDYVEKHLQPNSSEQLFQVTQNRLGDSTILVSIRCYSEAEIRVVDGSNTGADFNFTMTCGSDAANGGEIRFSDEVINAGTGQNVLQVSCTDPNNFDNGNNFIYTITGQYGGCSEMSIESACTAAAVDRSPNRPDVTGESDERSCETEGGSFSFIVCPLLRVVNEGIEWVDDRLTNLLYVDDEYYRNQGIVDAWAQFRNIAYLLLIPILLIMVIGTALGFNFVDAYTIKRSLPRLFVAIVFIALSYELSVLMIEVVNDVGRGVAGLIAAPFGGADELRLQNIFEASAGTDALFVGGVLGGVGFAVFGGVTGGILASYLGVVMLALLIVFFLLILRQLIIIFLIILAPVAIISWIFPGNDKLWKLWWGSFSKLLLIFPIIMGLLVTGRAFASVVNDSGADGILVTLIKLSAYIAPFFLIPFAFRYAGGAFANIAGLVNNRSKGLFDRQRKYRAENRKATIERSQEGMRFRNGPLKRFNNTAQNLSLAPAAVKSGGLAGFKSNLEATKRTKTQEELAHVMEDKDFMVWSGNDSVSGLAAQLSVGDVKGLSRQFEKKDASGKVTNAAQAQQQAQKLVDQSKKDYNGALRSGLVQTGAYKEGDADLNTAVSQVDIARRKFSSHALDQALTLQAMSGGTYFKDDLDTWRTAGLSTHGDDNSQANMVVKGRKALQGAGRLEGLGSFGGTMGHMQTLSASGADFEQAQKDFGDHLIANNPAATFANPALKDKYLDVVMDAYDRKIEAAAKTGDQDELIRSVASVNSLYSQLGSTKPVTAEKWAKGLMNKEIEVDETVDVPVTKTVSEFSGLYDSGGQPINTDKEVVVQEKQTRRVKRTVRAASGDFKNTAAWQETVKEFNTPEDFERRRNMTPEEQAALAQIEAVRNNSPEDLGGPGLGGDPPLQGSL